MFSAKDILEATGGQLVNGTRECVFSHISTDTRKIEKGSLFIAVKGPNFDGHDFVCEAASKGAGAAVVSRDMPSPKAGFSVILVKDTVKALGGIAKLHRSRFDIPVIALTGSNGKTTTKDMLALILSSKYKVLKNEGTENNFIGVPQTLLKLNEEHEIAVIELGTNHAGEIGYLADIVQPNCGMILNAGPSHLEFFGSVENVRKEKLDLIKRVGEDGSAVVNGDDPELVEAAKKMCDEVVTFGFNEDCDFTAENVRESDCGISFALNDTYAVKLRMLGRHNVHNASAAIAASSLYGIGTKSAVKALEGFVLPKLRMEYEKCGGIDFIFDCYNSNPASLESAIGTLRDMEPYKRKVLVVGDMLELGEAGPELHREAGRFAAKSKIGLLVSVGTLSGYILEGAQEEGIGGMSLLRFADSVEAAKALKNILKQGDLVLVKGSRGMKMEEIKKCFTTCSTR
ncbi:MAG: UDP-N-acetylmuramoyl-tripeptide--D-alanyl-D-alanine ligase [Candidatus Omnitrophica bacterium]|nr:UDP-N-acetylmuramoyl-tripeptide--D-alanyl-D-alanine ligase [Candidatus Omnitrophota bacterium]